MNINKNIINLLDSLADVSLDKYYEDILAEFLYMGFDPVRMWTNVLSHDNYNAKEIMLLLCACFQKGCQMESFLRSVKSSESAGVFRRLIAKYGILSKPIENDTITLYRLLSSGGYAAFKAFIHVEMSDRLPVSAEIMDGITGPVILQQQFIISLTGNITMNNFMWEPVQIINEFLRARINHLFTVKDKKNMKECMLDCCRYSMATRRSPIVGSSHQKLELIEYFGNRSYYISRNHGDPTTCINDLLYIHKVLFDEDFKSRFNAYGPIGAKMKTCNNSELAEYLLSEL
ncbi:nucleocapsid protein [Ramu stunt virus]|uniref:Nucleoprotein n=1 Tax=Ramu stunt virus TaxID=1738604 RepID=A0A0P0I685_9VIRU|nr:nucleocapsid protein [Ramu stunt virus]